MLVLLIESDRGSAVVPLRDGQAVVGRGEDCNLIVDDGLMSRLHAKFKLQDGAFWVEDLGSTNGVYVNGQRIAKPVSLEVGDLVLVGASKMRGRMARRVRGFSALDPRRRRAAA